MGRAAVVLAGIEGALVALLLFALPMVGELLDADLLPDVLNTWSAPLALVAVTGVVAVLSVVAWRRGDRSVLGQVVMVLALLGGVLLTADVAFEAVVGR